MPSRTQLRRPSAIAVLTVVGAVAFAVWGLRPNPLDGKLLTRLPVARDSNIGINSVPPESDGVCVTAYGHVVRPFEIDVKRRLWRRLPNLDTSYSMDLFLGVRNGLILQFNHSTHRVEERSWAGKIIRSYPRPIRSDFLPIVAGHTVIQVEDPVGKQCCLIDLRTGKAATLRMPDGCEIQEAFPGNRRFPAILEVVMRPSESIRDIQTWLVDARGNIARKLGGVAVYPNPIAVDHQGNLYRSDESCMNPGYSLWVYPVSNAEPRRIWRSTGCESSRGYVGTTQGAYVAIHRVTNTERALKFLATTMAGRLPSQYYRPLGELWDRVRTRWDVDYISSSGKHRTHVAHNVNEFKVSSDGKALYFIRGNQVRMVELRPPGE